MMEKLMPLPNIIHAELDNNDIPFELLESKLPFSFYQDASDLNIPLDNLARTLIIKANGQQRMFLLRAGDMLDFKSLTDLYGSSVELSQHYQTKLNECDPDSRVPVPDIQEIEMVVDHLLMDSEVVCFEAGIKGSYIKVNGEDFRRLHKKSTLSEFSYPAEKFKNLTTDNDSEGETLCSFTPKRIQQRVEQTLDLPAMPAIAQEVMRIRVDQRAGTAELAQIVSKDPSLSAQLISWATSPYYGYQGKIDSIQTAISRVLGFDLVLNLALGISVGKSLNVPVDGPLGLNAYWKQSVYTATLSEKLCSFISGKNRPHRGMIYLAGLLHNFGQLLLGHLFPPQFYLINRYTEMNPHIPVVEIEQHLLDTTHVEVGAWLMRSWNMPKELIAAVENHHKEMYEGEFAIYSNVVLIANRLLNRLDIGDSTQLILPSKIMHMLGIDEKDADRALNLILEDESELDDIARQMVA